MTTSISAAERLAKGVLMQVQDVAEFGLPSCYETYYHSLYDLFPDLPWDGEGLKMSLEWLVAQPELKAASDTIKDRGGPDYLFMFNDSLSRIDKEDVNDPLCEIDPRWNLKPWAVDDRPYESRRKARHDKEGR